MSISERLPQIITSSANSTFRELQREAAADTLKKTHKTIVAGAKLVKDALCVMPEQCLRLIVQEGFTGADDLVENFARRKRLVVLKKALFGQLDVFNTNFALLELAVPSIPLWDGRIDMNGCTLALPFQDPANIGAAVRSAVAFGVSRILLLQEAAHPFHPKSIRASAGAVFHGRFFKGPTLSRLAADLKDSNVPVFSLNMKGHALRSIKFPSSFLLVAGSEGKGLPADLREHSIAIPMRGPVESLNAATAISIALFYWSLQAG